MITRTATPERLSALCDGFVAVLIATLVLAGTRLAPVPLWPYASLRPEAPGVAVQRDPKEVRR